MDHTVERELTVPEEAEEVWRSLAEPEWLGEDATIELREAGEVRAGERDGFVEEADAPRRLVFWWSAPGEEATRVEIDLDELDGGTRVRVTESRPLAILDGRDLAVEFGGAGAAGPAEPAPWRSPARCADVRNGRRGIRRALRRHPSQPLLAARPAGRGDGDGPGSPATGQQAGRAEAPRHARGRGARGNQTIGSRGPLPPHPRPDVGGTGMDGGGGRAVGRPAGGADKQLARGRSLSK